MALGVPGVHPVKIESGERGLFPSLAGADLDDDVLLIERVAGYELAAELRERFVDLAGRVGRVAARDVPQVGVVGVDELPRLIEARLGGAQSAHGVDDRRQL